MINRFNRWVLMAIIGFAVPFWWLLIDSDRSAALPKPVHIADLRALAASIPGQRPTAIAAALVATRPVVGEVFAAGIGFQQRHLVRITWVLPVPDKGPIIIDPGVVPDDPDEGFFEKIDGAKLRLIGAETKNASLILRTGGSISLLSQASSAAQASTRPASFTTAQAVAPGVVLIPAPGHAPDTRLIYVQLADGREFLFAGNIAPLSENWIKLRLRSHLAAIWGPRQNDDETRAWLSTIRQLRAEAPRMNIVPGHDNVWLTQQVATGAVVRWKPEPALFPLPGKTG
ncbi:MAG: hypothetical protein M3N34_06130 [Pseudomonadota bacterium]|nr:hypothetical protein [Pseudomonadota bacterium]